MGDMRPSLGCGPLAIIHTITNSVKLNHRFYTKSIKEQNKILFIIAISAIAIILLSIILSIYSKIYLIGIFTIIIVLSIIAPFYDMPSLKKNGSVIYFSSLLISEKPKNGLIKIHGGDFI